MIEIHKNTKGLIFDLDGTLADTMPTHIESWQIAGIKYGVDITATMINELAGMPTVQVVQVFNKRYGWSIDPFEFKKEKNSQYLIAKKKAGTIQPIVHIVKIAKAHRGKMPMSVGTGSIRINAIHALSDLQISDWFEGLVSADEVENPKPHPETFLRCAEIIKLSPAECQVFEDGPMGIESALAAGMRVTNILTGELIEP